jgi:hypothetical protein
MTINYFKINGPKKKKDQASNLIFLERLLKPWKEKDSHNVLSLYVLSNFSATFKIFSSNTLKERVI